MWKYTRIVEYSKTFSSTHNNTSISFWEYYYIQHGVTSYTKSLCIIKFNFFSFYLLQNLLLTQI